LQGESGDPENLTELQLDEAHWIPAFAGMTSKNNTIFALIEKSLYF